MTRTVPLRRHTRRSSSGRERHHERVERWHLTWRIAEQCGAVERTAVELGELRERADDMCGARSVHRDAGTDVRVRSSEASPAGLHARRRVLGNEKVTLPRALQ